MSPEAELESQSKGPQFMIRAGGVGSLHQNKEKTSCPYYNVKLS